MSWSRADILAWTILASSSLALSAILIAGAIPAAILIGPMIAAIALGIAGATIRVDRAIFSTAQGVIGCLLAGSLTQAVVAEVVRDWPEMLFGTLSTVVASTAIGLTLARFGKLPGSTAAWGTSAGAASAMVVLAQEYGADPRLVATMQYVRVIVVVLTASLISKFLIETPTLPIVSSRPAAGLADQLPGLAATMAVAILGSWIGRRFGIPAGSLLIPLACGAAVNFLTPVHLYVPFWLLALSYTVVGWTIGLQFERGSLIRSIQSLPEMIASALAIVGLCGLAAYAMVRFMGVGALTAFLATSPGGIDSVAIIALSGGADMPFVMALQVLRVLVVVVTGPSIARFVARHARPD